MRMRNIAEGCLDSERKTGGVTKNKAKPCRNCGGFGHAHQDCRKEVKCFFCKKSGHRQYDCPAAKEKGRNQQMQQRTPSTPAVVTEDGSSAEPIAFIAEPVKNHLELRESSVVVDSIEGQNCSLAALVDTGSSASFVKYSIYLAYRKYFACEICLTVRKFINIKNLPLEVIGTVEVNLTLSLLKQKRFKVTLFVIKDQAFSHDLILGRDFLGSQNLTVVFRFREGEGEEEKNRLGLLAELPLFVDDNMLTKFEGQLQQTEIDFNFQTKQRLIRIISEVENSDISPVEDNYSVSVHLKDESVYAFAPRRFAHSERLELRKITDDLLERGIIKPSVSSYCG